MIRGALLHVSPRAAPVGNVDVHVVLVGLVACAIPVYAGALYLVGRERWYELTTTFRDALPVRA